MKRNAPERAFTTLISISVVPYALVAMLNCAAGLMLARVSQGSSHVVADPSAWLALAVLVVLALGAVLGLRSLFRQLHATVAIERRVRLLSVAVPPDLAVAARTAGLAGRLDLVEATSPYGFTYGMFRPRVVVSTSFVGSLTATELAALLAHERYHVRHRDPLKVVISRAARATAFFLPAVSLLHDRYLVGRELSADQRAVRHVGRRALVGALCKAATPPGWDELPAAAAMRENHALEARIIQLETGVEPTLGPIPNRALACTVVPLIGIAIVLTVTAAQTAGAMCVLCASACSLGWLAPIALRRSRRRLSLRP